MRHSLQKDRMFLNQQTRKKSSKLGSICSACTLLKHEILQLKQIQQKLAKEIKLIIALIPRQINGIILKIKAFSTSTVDQSSRPIIKSSHQTQQKYSDKRDSNQSKSSYQSKLKEEDSIIKESIKNELKVIKVLESKQKDLRSINQKHQNLRKSMSKESIKNNTHLNPAHKIRKFQSNSKLSLSSNPKRILEDYVIKCESNIQHQILSSPKFGSTQEEEKFELKRFSSQQSKSRKKSDPEGKGQIQQIKCQNGHQCYKGETVNRLPHGTGTLRNCCSQMPFKVNPKTLTYTGSFKFGLFQGKGILTCKDNVRFQGSFLKGMRHGEGIIYLEGASQKGFWQEDKLVFFK